MKEFKICSAVALGGFAGAICRYALSGLGLAWNGFPMGILIINLLGAFLLAGFMELSLERLRLSPTLRFGVSTGFLGAFTTFSGLCAEAFSLATRNAGLAVLYTTLSLMGGVLAAGVGILLVRRVIVPGVSHE